MQVLFQGNDLKIKISTHFFQLPSGRVIYFLSFKEHIYNVRKIKKSQGAI